MTISSIKPKPIKKNIKIAKFNRKTTNKSTNSWILKKKSKFGVQSKKY